MPSAQHALHLLERIASTDDLKGNTTELAKDFYRWLQKTQNATTQEQLKRTVLDKKPSAIKDSPLHLLYSAIHVRLTTIDLDPVSERREQITPLSPEEIKSFDPKAIGENFAANTTENNLQYLERIAITQGLSTALTNLISTFVEQVNKKSQHGLTNTYLNQQCTLLKTEENKPLISLYSTIRTKLNT